MAAAQEKLKKLFTLPLEWSQEGIFLPPSLNSQNPYLCLPSPVA